MTSELDAQIAEKVMGHKADANLPLEVRAPENDIWRAGDKNYRWQGCRIPPYSTEWGAVGLVVEKMRERGAYLTLLGLHGDAGYSANFNFGGAGALAVEITAPLAICKAALAAMEGGK